MIVIAVSAVVGVVVGLVVRSSLGLGNAERASDSSISDGAKVSEDSDSELKTPKGRTLAKDTERMKKELELAPRPKRMLWFATRAENATPDELRRLLRLAGDDYAMKKMIAARWAAIAPQHMFDSLAADLRNRDRTNSGLMRTLLTEWSRSDPKALIAALDDEQLYPRIDSTRMTASHYLMLANPEAGLEVLERWNVRHFIPDMKKLAEWAESSPREAAERVAKINADHAGLEALGAVGKAWAKVDPEAALTFALELGGKKQEQFASKAMEVWAAQDLDAASAFASEQESIAFRGRLARGLLAEWGKHDAGAALKWAQENLKSQARADAIGSLVSAAAKEDPHSAAALVTEMNPGGAQLEAAKELLRSWVKRDQPEKIREAVDWLGGLEDHKLAKKALEDVYWHFIWNDPENLFAIVESEHGHILDSRVIHEAAEAQVRKSPQAALAWADGLPEDRRAEARRGVVSSWLSMQPAQATEWATGLPEGPQRDTAINAVAYSFAHRRAEQLKPWLEQLSEGEVDRVRGILKTVRNTDEQTKKIDAVLAEF